MVRFQRAFQVIFSKIYISCLDSSHLTSGNGGFFIFWVSYADVQCCWSVFLKIRNNNPKELQGPRSLNTTADPFIWRSYKQHLLPSRTKLVRAEFMYQRSELSFFSLSDECAECLETFPQSGPLWNWGSGEDFKCVQLSSQTYQESSFRVAHWIWSGMEPEETGN